MLQYHQTIGDIFIYGGIDVGLLTSKKFQAAVVGVVVMVLAEINLDLDPEVLLAVVSPVIAYILGQGIADVGKEKAKVEAANGKK